MNHVLENCLIVAVLLIIILIPVYLAVRNSRNHKKKKISSELIKAEKDFQANFHRIDQLDSTVIAMDRDKKVIVQMDLKDYKSQLIDLKTLKVVPLKKRNKETRYNCCNWFCETAANRRFIILFSISNT